MQNPAGVFAGEKRLRRWNDYMNPPCLTWTKEHGWPQYLVYDGKKWDVDIWRDDLKGRWYWTKGGNIVYWKRVDA